MKFESEQEANELVKLLDLAVKNGGLQVAGAAHYFFEKIKKSFEEETLKKEEAKKKKPKKIEEKGEV